jgi:RNA polymerase sigma-70 factor (ECF subfamily)
VDIDQAMSSGSDPASTRRLADWFRHWRAPLRNFLRGRGTVPASEIDDVAQEVFLRLMRYNRTELVEHPQAYLFKMASNVAAEWAIRSRNARPHDSRWLGDLASESTTSLGRVAAEAEVRRAIETLGVRQREMLKLHYFEGLGHAEIAARLGATQRTVKRVLIASYDKLRHELDPELLGVMDDEPE